MVFFLLLRQGAYVLFRPCLVVDWLVLSEGLHSFHILFFQEGPAYYVLFMLFHTILHLLPHISEMFTFIFFLLQ